MTTITPDIFQPGDLVECLQSMNPGDEFTAGREYTVESSNGVFVNVEADDDGGPNGWGVKYFKLAGRAAA